MLCFLFSTSILTTNFRIFEFTSILLEEAILNEWFEHQSFDITYKFMNTMICSQSITIHLLDQTFSQNILQDISIFNAIILERMFDYWQKMNMKSISTKNIQVWVFIIKIYYNYDYVGINIKYF